MHIDLKGPGACGFSIGMDPSGREHAVVVAKRQLHFPTVSGGVCSWSGEAPEICTSDVFSGEEGLSAVLIESDYALRKPYCDVILNGAAYAPNGVPTGRVNATMQCGTVTKSVAVFGKRIWEPGVVGSVATEPEPFDRQVISYDFAFGGTDTLDPADTTPAMYPLNTVGMGWHRWGNRAIVDGTELPRCENPLKLVSAAWDEDIIPFSFGPLARGHPDRAKFAGTYDDAWVEERFPHLPDDYDDRYAQSAPLDQQMRHPVGGEVIKLNNLMSGQDGPFEMHLPALDLPVVFARLRGPDIPVKSVTDTIIIEPDRRAVSVVTRASLPLNRDILEMREAIVGKRGKGFWRARKLGKAYNPGLGGLGNKTEVPEL